MTGALSASAVPPHAAGLPVVLLIDDHPVVRAGCQRLLADFQVIEAATAADALARLALPPPDLVILDLGLPDLPGLELLDRLLAAWPACPVLVFSMHGNPAVAARALRAGARGYVSKTDAPEALSAAVAALLAGGRYLSHALACDLALHSLNAPEQPLQRLTRRERQILARLGRGLALGAIAADLGLSYKTVANGCSTLKDKLDARSTADLIRIAVEAALDPDAG